MATHRIVCHGCRKPFTAKSPRAKWCSSTCQKRQRRAAAAAKAAKQAPDHPLVALVRTELAAADVASSVDGLLAVHLALAIAAAERSGKTGPVAAFRTARAAALGLVEAAAPAGEGDADEPALPGEGDEQLAQILAMRDQTHAAIAAG